MSGWAGVSLGAVAGSFLPLAGGTMTGNIVTANAVGAITMGGSTATIQSANAAGSGTASYSITTGTVTSGNASSGALTLSTGNGSGTGNSGTINVTVGTAGSTGAGGAINVTAGTGGTGGGAGGDITVLCGAGGAAGGNGGALSLTAGAGATGGTGGAVTLTSGAGQGAAASGAVTIGSGTAGSTGNSAALTLRTGAGGSVSGASGNVAITTGNTTSGTSGSIVLTVGSPTAGTRGSITANALDSTWTLRQADAGTVGFTITHTTTYSTTSTMFHVQDANTFQRMRLFAIAADSTLLRVGDASTVASFDVLTTALTGAITLRSIPESGGITLRSLDRTTATATGQTVTVLAGAGNTTGTGGLVAITAGAGGNDGIGGGITLTSGAGGGGNRRGGNITFTSGVGSGNQVGGTIVGTAGQGGATGAGGGITFTTGAGGATSGVSGNLALVTGNTTSGNSGDIQLTAGTATGGTNGRLVVTTSNWSIDTSSIVTHILVDAGATGGPDYVLYRNSASAAAADVMGRVIFDGNSATPTRRTMSMIQSVIVTATNGAEDAKLEFYNIEAGASNLAMWIAQSGQINADLGGGAGNVTVFDAYDDVSLIRSAYDIDRERRERSLEALSSIGLVTRKKGGSGWAMGLQPWLALLAGGVYQTADRVSVLEARVAALEAA